MSATTVTVNWAYDMYTDSTVITDSNGKRHTFKKTGSRGRKVQDEAAVVIRNQLGLEDNEVDPDELVVTLTDHKSGTYSLTIA